jgi:hypothetical protein
MMARKGDVSRSRKIGSASIATAFAVATKTHEGVEAITFTERDRNKTR